ncbi:SDR family oxidoreductase [Sphingomonas mucosissima]|uniref:Fatty acyl-CoA reductase n=1 Tax=Sphingomonas mucosissima TaxID=370959 RepID=A0A245ZEZ3_9SPHN|nr:SDR family oxidoreductase [Sphingomonas mucosissima]OWK28315.1 fatty acyl-CoA reductase [Sphingomonas mucosissima]
MVEKVAVVTGGSAGIGLATAEALGRAGWSVAIIARDPARLEEAAALVRASGARALAVPADVADAAAVDAAADLIERELGPIEAWVNNAMSTVIARADEVTAEEYARVTATTYLGQVHGTLAALRHMKPRGRGAIIQISSILGFRGVPMQAAYCAAKFAVSGFTDSLRAELIAEESKVTLTVIYLPAVNTPQFSWSRNRSGRKQLAPPPVYDPRVCAQAVLRAVESPTRELWVGLRTFGMGVGQAAAPGLADQMASGFEEDQMGEPVPDRLGNLFEPVPAPAQIDGPWQADVTSATGRIVTSRNRTALKITLGTAGGILALLGTRSLANIVRGRA